MKKEILLSLLLVTSSLIFAQSPLIVTTTVCGEASSVRMTGPWWGWSPLGGPEASNNGDGTWTFTLDPPPTADMEYLLVVDGYMESLIPGNTTTGDWSCTPITDQATYANRQWTYEDGYTISNVFGTCGTCEDLIVYGCTDSAAANYNPSATEDDGTCVFGINLPIDFEGGPYTFTDFDGGSSSVVANPYNTAENSSANVVEHVRNGGQFWAGTYITTEPIDFSSGSVINMKVYTPAANIPVLLKLEALTGENVELTTNTSVGNQWEELSYDFGTQPSELYTRVVVIFNMGVVGDGSANSTYYFDDIAFATGDISGCTDPLANNYNPNATIDDGSCTYGTTILQITTTVCSEASEVKMTGPWWAWDPTAGPEAADNGDGTWTFTFDPAPDQDMEYLLVVDGVQEDLLTANTTEDNWSCTPVTDFWSYANRLWTVGSGDVSDIYYGTCGTCDNPFSVIEAKMNPTNFYPNPVSDFIHLLNSEAQSIAIFNIRGQQVLSTIISDKLINISDISSGIYTIRVADDKGNFTYSKLIKE